ncbi:YciI family protein [Bradyrhizobium elkanii]|uniref:YciI family protein n=1 Tax=Bradyrhizobium elkanii TaxID=29448 RepID=UPI00209E88FE|nr:YciI family protein [Bradyrhizobium elkanii]MCP1968233.1 uncharacterized protein YciI [Bradyrhizobium elkanii]MCS4110267.1 uncharacterized protein YciI [Bradyrhizobium elkanii]
MQFLVLAFDQLDEAAAVRRREARAAHIEGVRALRKEGRFRDGGALLDTEGRVIGSALLLDFSTRGELERCLASDPYQTNQVWGAVTVHRASFFKASSEDGTQ